MAASGKAKNNRFRVTIREHKFSVTKSTLNGLGSPGPCPSTPAWLKALVDDGAILDLDELQVQAGRHFAAALVPHTIPIPGSLREKAAFFAGIIVAMAKPRVSKAGKLWLTLQRDDDIQRLCSEILGVGAGIALLGSAGVIDGRTVKKMYSTFDFVGRPRGGGGLIDLEFKGTVDDGSTKAHRLSFRRKLTNSGRLGTPQTRGYDQAIGVTFVGWTHGGGMRKADFEVMDPGEPRPEDREQAVREIIDFYAKRYEEAVGMLEAASRLAELARREDLFDRDADLSRQVGSGTHPGRFNRSSMSIIRGTDQNTYWGSFWEPEFVPHASVVIDGRSSRQYPVAYMGVDRRIVLMLRDRRLFDLLDYSTATGAFTFDEQQGASGIGLTLSDGTIVVWSSSLPPREIVVDKSA